MADKEEPLDLFAYPRVFFRETLARWWCELNCDRWPDDFPEPMPPGWLATDPAKRRTLPGADRAWDALCRTLTVKEALDYWDSPFRQGVDP